MKQISDGETTTSSRPAFRGLTTASVMALSGSPWGGRWKRLLLPYAPGDFKAGSPYTRRRARVASTHVGLGRRLLRPSSHQRGPGAGVRTRAERTRRETAGAGGPLGVGSGPLRRTRSRGDAGATCRDRGGHGRAGRLRGPGRTGTLAGAPLRRPRRRGGPDPLTVRGRRPAHDTRPAGSPGASPAGRRAGPPFPGARFRRRGQPGGSPARSGQGGGPPGMRAGPQGRGAPGLQRLGGAAPARGQRAPPPRGVDGRGHPPEHRRIPRPADAGRVRAGRGGGSLHGVDRRPAQAAAHVPRPARAHRRPLRADALRRVQPALRVLRGAGGGGEAGRRAVQRNSRSSAFLRSCGSLIRTSVGPIVSAPGPPPTPALTRVPPWGTRP